MCLICRNVGNFFGRPWGIRVCKHVYHILQIIMFCGFIKEFIHYCTWSWLKFSICKCILKPLDSSDITSQLHLLQIKFVFLIHQACCSCFNYVGSLVSNYSLIVFFPMCIISIILMKCIFSFVLMNIQQCCGIKVCGLIKFNTFY